MRNCCGYSYSIPEEFQYHMQISCGNNCWALSTHLRDTRHASQILFYFCPSKVLCCLQTSAIENKSEVSVACIFALFLSSYWQNQFEATQGRQKEGFSSRNNSNSLTMMSTEFINDNQSSN